MQGSLQRQPTMSTFEEDEMGVTEGVESEEMEGMGLRDEKKREERLSVGCRAYGYAVVVCSGIWGFL
jgi:hypothetical protein